MRYFKIVLTAILVSNLYNCSDKVSEGKALEITKENLVKTINKFNQAFQEGNVAVLDSMTSENYLHTNGNSKAIRKKGWFNYLSKRENEIKSQILEVMNYHMDEMQIEMYKNMAIVTGKIVVSNKIEGVIQKNEYRITNVWVYESGNWKRAGFHDGKIE